MNAPRKLTVKAHVFDDPNGPRTLKVQGQVAKTLAALVEAGDSGVSTLEAIDNGLSYRFSAYAAVLRSRDRLIIETQREEHPGGWHGRHILRSRVELVEILKPEGRAHV